MTSTNVYSPYMSWDSNCDISGLTRTLEIQGGGTIPGVTIDASNVFFTLAPGAGETQGTFYIDYTEALADGSVSLTQSFTIEIVDNCASATVIVDDEGDSSYSRIHDRDFPVLTDCPQGAWTVCRGTIIGNLGPLESSLGLTSSSFYNTDICGDTTKSVVLSPSV